MAFKRYIKLIVCTETGRSESTIKAPNVTPAMIDAAYDLIYTLGSNKRRTTSLYTKELAAKAKLATKKPKTPKKPKKPTKPTKHKKAVLAAVGQMGADAIAKELGRPSRASRIAKPLRGNDDGTGIHAMVEGNRDDDRT